MMVAARADTVVSVIEVPHRFHPYKLMNKEDGWLHDFWEEPIPFDRFHRQSVPVLYARNGPAILATRIRVLFEEDSFYGQRVLPYLMSHEDSIDINSPFDLRLAEWLLAERQSKNDM